MNKSLYKSIAKHAQEFFFVAKDDTAAVDLPLKIPHTSTIERRDDSGLYFRHDTVVGEYINSNVYATVSENDSFVIHDEPLQALVYVSGPTDDVKTYLRSLPESTMFGVLVCSDYILVSKKCLHDGDCDVVVASERDEVSSTEEIAMSKVTFAIPPEKLEAWAAYISDLRGDRDEPHCSESFQSIDDYLTEGDK